MSALQLKLLRAKETFAAHHTDLFHHDDFTVLRRGGALELAVEVEKTGDSVLQDVKLVEKSGGHEVELRCSPSNSTTEEVRCQAEIPFNAPVGAYNLQATLVGPSSMKEARYHHRVVVLCNAWCVTDEVYMEEESERQEYVLQKSTRVYAGSVYGKPWNLALYRKTTLKAVVGLLDRCSVKCRSSSITLSRELTSLLNSPDNNGVLQGNWSGDYSGGTAPWKWQGSGAILEEYLETGSPVEYGQCWVFSGLLCAVFRVLGIPCRSVTTFDSAHDTEMNRSIDRYYDEDGEKLEDMSYDSIWNFHVWNEAWMTRVDLPAGYGGWQVVDATPQERSDGRFQTGPSSVRGIKEGLPLKYDSDFVIAEVNADVREYVVMNDGSNLLSRVKTDAVGSLIVTKQVGNQWYQNITSNYKYPEGSAAERASLLRGDTKASEGDIDFKVSVPERDSLTVGSKVRVGVSMKNKSSDKAHKVDVHIIGRLCRYNGKVIANVLDFRKSATVSKDSSREVEAVLTPANYLEKLQDKVFFVFHVFARVKHSTSGEDKIAQVFSDTQTVTLSLPELVLTTKPKLTEGASAQVHFRLVNPLRVPLTGIEVLAEGDGLLEKNLEIPVKSINAQETVTGSFRITGLEVGKHDIMVSLHSDQLVGIESTTEVEVIEDMADDVDLPGLDEDEFEVEDVNLGLAANRAAHFTSEYEDESMLIVRRGFPVEIKLNLNKSLKKVNCLFRLVLAKRRRGRSHFIELQQQAVAVEDRTVKTTIPLPANMAVGRYRLTITIQEQSGLHTAAHIVDGLVCVLFNPFCKDDEVFMENSEQRGEYVLDEAGAIWVGKYNSMRRKKWDFGQFEDVCLEAAMYLIEMMASKDRHSAVTVSRYLSSILNSCDNNGVLEGNWSGDYSGGHSPMSWVASEQIFSEYMKTKAPVKYGQCFIYSGIMTTALRTLGIPGRSVTNFVSAHDTHFNRAVDYYCTKDGDAVEELNDDSIWNFHVWNEAWMKRDDLPPGYGGWQVVDSTPQELSGRLYQTGPAPVKAVKLGQALGYDTNFIIAEVNADQRIWVQGPDGEYILKQMFPSLVGKMISTKAVGSMRREDITENYKFPEGSLRERAALGIALPPGQKQNDDRSDDVMFNLDVKEAIIGGEIRIVIAVQNSSKESRTFHFRVTGTPIMYTGKRQKSCVDIRQTVTLPAGINDTLNKIIPPTMYMPYLPKGGDAPYMEFVVFAEVAETKQCGVSIDTIHLQEPELELSLMPGQDAPSVGRPTKVAVKLVNTTGQTLTNLELSYRGRSLGYSSQDISDDIPPKGEVNLTLEITPKRRGKRTLTCRLHSPQLVQVHESLEINIQ